MSRIRLLLWICVLVSGSLLAGCMKGEQTVEEIDAPEGQSEVEQEENAEASENGEANVDKDEVTETEEVAPRELYLIDESGLVVPQQLELPKSESAALQAMEYLVKDGPVTELLPSGFQAVLPAGTEIYGVNLEDDGTMTVDVSEEFADYEAEDELKIIQSMTHTLTQFDSVDRIKLWINGENQSEMPVNQTPLSEGYSEDKGINLDVSDKPDLNKDEAATIYYPKEYDEQMNYVPVTTYISKEEAENPYTAVVKRLLEGPSYDKVVKDVFNDDTVLAKDPSLEDGVLQLEFNEGILKDKETPVIADEVMETLVRTMTDQEDVDSVQVTVENHDTVAAENGSTYDEPVTVQDFTSKEKM